MADNTTQTQPAEGGREPTAEPKHRLNQGESAQAPAEGGDDSPGELPGSPKG